MGNIYLSQGDLIFIGDVQEGGRFCRITKNLGGLENSRTYGFEPLNKTLASISGHKPFRLLSMEKEQ